MKRFISSNIINSNFVLGINIMNNVMYINTMFGVKKLYMPNFFFFKDNNDGSISIIIGNYFKYSVLFRQLIALFVNGPKIFFFKLKLRGLGYKLYTFMRKRLIKFFFAYNHFFYLHVPKQVFFKRLKRKFVFFSNNKSLLNDLFVKLLHLKKMDFYERANTFIIPKKILYIKKRK